MMILIRYHHEYIMGGVELNKIATMVWETREMGERERGRKTEVRSGEMAGGVGASVHSYKYYSLYCNRSHIHLTRSIQIERLRYRGGASHPPHPSETPGDCRGTLGRPLRETPSAGSYAGAALWRCRRCWKGTYGRGEGGERTGKGRCERGVGMKMDGREGRWCWRRWRAGRGARVRVFTVCKKSCSL